VGLNKELRELAARFKSWLSDTSALDSAVVREVLALPLSDWRAFYESYATAERAMLTEALLVRGSVTQVQAPKEAVPICRLAINFAKSYVGRTADEQSRAILLEGDSWRECAYSQFRLGDFVDAQQAANEAAFNYSVLLNDGEPGELSLHGDVLAHYIGVIGDYYRNGAISAEPLNGYKRVAMENATRLGVLIGQILHSLGKTEDGLAMIERSCEVLLFLESKDRYVAARNIYALVLGEALRWPEALEVFESTAALAAESDDLEVQAILLGNIGACYYYLGNRTKAKECAEVAVQMLEDLERHIDAIRPRTLLVLLLMEEGERNNTKYLRAAAELFKSRAAWLAAGMKNEAARVMVRIIRAFIMAGRQQSINWAEMNRTFNDARLGRAALGALRYLEDIAARRTLNPADVDDAEEMLAHLAPSGELFEEAG